MGFLPIEHLSSWVTKQFSDLAKVVTQLGRKATKSFKVSANLSLQEAVISITLYC